MTGTLFGVGVGPGDPDLLTMKAIKTIKAADVVIAPMTEKNNTSLALSITREYIPEQTTVLHQIFPMIHDKDALQAAWKKNKDEIEALLARGKKVVFLTLGDPMIYSTYIYIFKLFKDGPYEIITIPGIPSFCDVAAKMGIPIVEGNKPFTVIPATALPKYNELLQKSDNLVIMKVYRNYKDIIKTISSTGHIHNSAMISNCGLENEKIYSDLSNLGDEKIDYLSTIIAKNDE